MVELTQRQRVLLGLLYHQSSFVTVQRISSLLGVSVRTTRKDLGVVEAYLAENGIELQRVPHKGIRVESGDRALPTSILSCTDIGEFVFSPEERCVAALAMLLCLPVTTFEEIARSCHVSRQTTMSDISRVERHLSERGLVLRRRQGVGLFVDGDELSVRRCYAELLSSPKSMEVAAAIASACLGEDTLSQSESLTERFEQLLGVSFVERSTFRLIAAFILFRSKSGHALSEEELARYFGAEREGRPAGEATFLGAIVGELEQELPHRADCAYLASLAFAQRTKVGSGGTPEAGARMDDVARAISRALLDALCNIHMIDEVSQQPIIDGLTNHLRAALYRCQNNLQVNDDVPRQITASISLLYDFTRQQMRAAEQRWGVTFNDGEIAYIAMYLDCIYETSVRDQVRLSVLIVCAFGMASSSIVMTRLSHALAECQVIGPLSEEEARAYLSENSVDLIVSTSAFECESTPVLVVDPLLRQEGLDDIKTHIMQLSYDKTCALFLKAYTSGAPEEGPHCIGDYVDVRDVQVGVSCADWRDAIRLAARPLLESEKLEQRYVGRMIEAVESYGPYMVLTPGVAYVHAGMNDGARCNCTAMLVLDRDISFGAHGKKSVRAIVVLGFHDKARNDLLGIATILEKEGNVSALRDNELDAASLLALHD